MQDTFKDQILQTLGSVYKNIQYIENKGNLYVFGFGKDTYSFDLLEEFTEGNSEGTDSFCFAETNILVIDKSCIVPFDKKYLLSIDRWYKEFETDTDALKGFTMSCEVFSYIVEYQQKKEKNDYDNA